MSGVSRVYDPSRLHLKKELTQIRKASRVLRDPGTTSSWKSPLSSSRSALNHNGTNALHNHFYGNDLVDQMNVARNGGGNGNNGRELKDKEKERRVVLYNWRSNKSSSEKSLGGVELDSHDGDKNKNNNNNDDDDDDGSMSDPLNQKVDSKSDTCIANHHHSQGYGDAFRCRDTRLVSMASPGMVRRSVGRKKSRRPSSSSVILRQQMEKQKKQKKSRREWGVGVPSSSLVLSQDDSVSLIDQSDYSQYCGSVESPLLASKIITRKNKNKKPVRGGSRRGDSSYTLSTPALSTSSYNRFLLGSCRNPSTVGSWDGTSASFDGMEDEDEEDPLHLPGRQGCGISCYWSKRTPKHNKGSCGSGSCYSPSLSDTLRRTGGRLLCGSQNGRKKKHRVVSQMAQQGRAPLLDGGGGSSLGTGYSDDELSTNFGELNLEGLSRLDGRRWSTSCRSQEGLEIEEEGSSENNIRSLSQRYRPIFFDELIGQNIAVHSLMNSISRGRVAPVYLFQGPRGTGKTSTAKIFAAALNCLVTEGSKPCGICRECTDFISGKSKHLIEVDGTNKKSVDRVRYLLKTLSIAPSSAFSAYKILLIEECHLLPSKAWLAFLKFLEEPPPRVVFVFVTTDVDNVPRTVLSRCQKYLFNKIKDGDIVSRLRKIAAEENLDVDPEALDLIALNADGSLRDAETMLDQLSLLGKRITPTLVNELVGVVPDEKLLELLELALSSNTAMTVKRARELMDSGVDPLVLMSQMASLIMDIITGSYQLADGKSSNSSSDGHHLSDTELEKLKHALKLLSEAEKQLRVSSERSTWFTATLLQLGSVTSPEFTLSGSSKKQSSKTTEGDPSSASGSGQKQTSDFIYGLRRSASPHSLPGDDNQNASHPEQPYLLTGAVNSHSKPAHKRSVNSVDSTSSNVNLMGGSMNIRQATMDGLDDIWLQCIERCHSKTLRQLLLTHGKLLSIGEAHGVLIVYIAFADEDVKCRAERFLISITNSIEMVLRRSVEARIILLPNGLENLGAEEKPGLPNKSGQLQPGKAGNMDPRKGYDDPDSNKLNGGSNSSLLLDERSEGVLTPTNATQGIPIQRIESIIREQRLETAWLQAAEKSTPRSMSRLRPEKNQVLPQDTHNQMESGPPKDLQSDHWHDELNHEIKALKVSDTKGVQKDVTSTTRMDHPPISPSLLHQSGFAANLNKEFQGYESGPGNAGCNMFLCWNTRHRRKVKINQARPSKISGKRGRFLCFGERRKTRRTRGER